MSLVVDVHTHMLNKEWLSLLRRHGGPHDRVNAMGALPDVIHLDGEPFMTPLPEMFDYERRIRKMDNSRVDLREDAVRMCVDVCGPENVLYGSDYPHNIGDMTGCLARVDALGGELRRLVRGRNAAAILNLS